MAIEVRRWGRGEQHRGSASGVGGISGRLEVLEDIHQGMPRRVTSARALQTDPRYRPVDPLYWFPHSSLRMEDRSQEPHQECMRETDREREQYRHRKTEIGRERDRKRQTQRHRETETEIQRETQR